MADRRSAAGDALTELILKVFRLNGRFLAVAEQITFGTGLSAARWQVLGAVLPEPLSVAGVARNMGLTRQSVQRLFSAGPSSRASVPFRPIGQTELEKG